MKTIIEKTQFEHIEGIAAKLVNDGLTADTYSVEKANAILSRCVLPTALITMNEAFSGMVIYLMRKFEAI